MADIGLDAELVANAALYSAWLSPRGRRWFVRKIVAHASTAADIPAKSRQYLQQAKVIVDAPSTRTHSFAVPGTHLDIRSFLVQIGYASLGTYPAVFLDQTNPALLEFVNERRLRTILQMRDYVNPLFAFPADIEHSSLRSTQTHWEGVSQVGAEKLWPFVLKSGAAVDRKAAVEELFRPGLPADETDVNAVDCQTAGSMVLLDSLLQADDAGKLFEKLDLTAGGYLAIDNPDGPFRVNNGVRLGGFRILDRAVTAGTNVVLSVIPPMAAAPPFPVVLLDAAGVSEVVTISDVKNPSPDQLLEAGVAVTPENIAKARIRTAAVPVLPSKLTAAQVNGSFGPGTRVLPQGVPPFHFLSDPRPLRGLFEHSLIPVEGFQPGDVVHVLGHPLTREKVPTSPFGGERCVIVNPWALTTYLMSVTGHGVGVQSLNGLALSMLIDPNRLLTVARQILGNCLDPSMVATPVANGTNVEADDDVLEIIGRALSLTPAIWQKTGFYIDGNWAVHNFPAIKGGDLDWWAKIEDDPLDQFGGYPAHWALVVEGHFDLGPEGVLPIASGDLFAFGYWPDEPVEDDLLWKTIVDRNFVGLLHVPIHNATSTDRSLQYVIPYLDDQAGVVVAMPLYDKVADDTAIPTVLTYSDLAPQLFNVASDDSEAWVLRPRVSADPGYLAHLRAIGALPATP